MYRGLTRHGRPLVNERIAKNSKPMIYLEELLSGALILQHPLELKRSQLSFHFSVVVKREDSGVLARIPSCQFQGTN